MTKDIRRDNTKRRFTDKSTQNWPSAFGVTGSPNSSAGCEAVRTGALGIVREHDQIRKLIGYDILCVFVSDSPIGIESVMKLSELAEGETITSSCSDPRGLRRAGGS